MLFYSYGDLDIKGNFPEHAPSEPNEVPVDDLLHEKIIHIRHKWTPLSGEEKRISGDHLTNVSVIETCDQLQLNNVDIPVAVPKLSINQKKAFTYS